MAGNYSRVKRTTLLEFMDAAGELPSRTFVQSELWSYCWCAYFSTMGDVLFSN